MECWCTASALNFRRDTNAKTTIKYPDPIIYSSWLVHHNFYSALKTPVFVGHLGVCPIPQTEERCPAYADVRIAEGL